MNEWLHRLDDGDCTPEARSEPERRACSRAFWHLSAIGVIFLGTLILRLLLIGGPPCSDDGYYAFNAEMASRGIRMFPAAPLNLYASLVSVVGMAPQTPLLRFRAVDAAVAAGAAVMLFGFLCRWVSLSIALVMASGWSLATNLPLFVESGFRNPITAAMLVYLAALWCVSCRSRSAPFWAGLLIPLAVALREPFVFIPIVSLYLAAALHGRRGLVAHVVGLTVAGAVILLGISMFRGSLRLVLDYYRELNAVYTGFAGYWVPSDRWASLRFATRASVWLFPPVLAGLGWLVARGPEQRAAKGLAVLLFLPPLPEIFGKVCFAYHWAQLLLGVVFLGALGISWLTRFQHSGGNARWIASAACLALAGLAGELDGRSVFHAYLDGFRLTREFAPVMIWGNWDDGSIARSAFLQAARYVKERTTDDDRIIAGFLGEQFYPLAGRMPPSEFATNLGAMTFKQYAQRRPEVIDALRKHPPRLVIDILMFPTDKRQFWPDFDQRYHLARAFPRDERQHAPYGQWGIEVWELNRPAQP